MTWRYHGRSGSPAGSIRSRSAMISRRLIAASSCADARSRREQRLAARAHVGAGLRERLRRRSQPGEIDLLRAVGRRLRRLLLDLADVLEDLPAVRLVVERQHLGVGEPQQRDAGHLRREHAERELRIDVLLEPGRVVVGRVIAAVAAAAVQPHVHRRDADVIEERGVVGSRSERADRRRLQHRLPSAPAPARARARASRRTASSSRPSG